MIHSAEHIFTWTWTACNGKLGVSIRSHTQHTKSI
jgi:hypothetical protein